MNRDSMPLDARLAADTQGEFKATLIADLQTLSGDIRRHLDAGVSPSEYERLSSLMAAADSAMHVVEQLWKRLH